MPVKEGKTRTEGTFADNGKYLEGRGPVDDLRSLGDLAALMFERLTAPVEGMHSAITERAFRWTGPLGKPVQQVYNAVAANVYGAIRITGSALGAAVGLGVAVRRDAGGTFSPSRASRMQAAINAIWGDELEQRRNPLSIEMGLRDFEGQPVDPIPVHLARSFPLATPSLVVLVHGLGQTERCWLGQGRGEDTTVGLGDRLAGDPSLTPLLVRYNSGRHISDNGVALAELLEQLWKSWPTPIEQLALVGHSMGGLVIRSACHIGQESGHDWVAKVRQVVTVGSPHLGAPLEKVANVLSWGLKVAPETRPLADFLNTRSVGIKDLRFGAVVEEDWQGTEPDALFQDTVWGVPPLDGADHHFVAATVTADPAHPVGSLLGDLMVRVRSGTGQGNRRRIRPTDIRIFGGRRHVDLLADPVVHDQVHEWLTTRTSIPTNRD